VLTLPQNSFPDESGKILFPACLAPRELSALLGAVFIAADGGNFTDDMKAGLDAMEEAMAFLDAPENAACFDFCALIERKYGSDMLGYVLLVLLDGECGTSYSYPAFCTEVAYALANYGATAETFYAAIVSQAVTLCAADEEAFPVFPTLCDMVTTELGATPTKAEVNALLTSCGIAVPEDYDWTHLLLNTGTNPGWVAWSSTPYANVPAQRTRFSWNSTDGLITTFGTSGEPGSVTTRHRLYAKLPYASTDLEQITVHFTNPQTQDATVQFYLHNSGVQIEATAGFTIPASSAHDIVLPNLSGNSDLFSLVITGGAAQTGAHPGIKVPAVTFRGRGTDPF